MDGIGLLLDKTCMGHFDGLDFFRANHIPDYRETVDRTFATHALNYCRAGELELSLNGGAAQRLCGPVAYLTRPGFRFRYSRAKNSAAAWDHAYVSFTGPRVARWKREGLFPGPAESVWPITEPEAFGAGFTALLACLHSTPPDTELAVHLLEGLLMRLRRQSAPPPPGTHRAEIATLLARVRSSPERAWNFQREAGALGVSAGQLRRLFIRHAATSPVQWLLRCRLETAATLLRSGSLRVKEIAERCGFGDAYYFTRLFKRRHGQSPSAYRRQFQREIG